MNKTETENNKTVFQASIHVFVPLMQIKKVWKAAFINNCHQIFPASRIKNTEADLWYWELSGKEQTFSYNYCIVQKGDKLKESVSRKVTLRLFLVKFVSSQLNPSGRYYLVLGTDINRNFSNGSICDEKGLIYLKKAFYEHGDEGLHNSTGGAPYFHDWLSSIVEDFTGHKPNGHFNRHYIVNIKATVGDFDKEYSHGIPKRYDEVIPGADRLAYALLYGNDNIEVVPEETIQEVIELIEGNIKIK